MRKLSPLLAVLLYAGPCVGAAQSPSATLQVTMTKVAAQGGPVYVALFVADADFPNPDKPTVGKIVEPQGHEVQVTFEGLRPGRYAVAVYQDQNRNHALDRSWIGKPKEPFGFSKNVRPRLGPPHFEDAAIAVPGPGTRIIVEMQQP